MLAHALPWKRLGLWLGAGYLALMFLTVVVTGHHYILDIAGGLITAGVAFLVARLLPEELPWPWCWGLKVRLGPSLRGAGVPGRESLGLPAPAPRLEPTASADPGVAD
jgi:hypothetical protein